MREKLYTKWKGGLNRLCFLLMCFCWTTVQSWAVGEDVHLTIENGKTYEFEAFNSYYLTYVATANGQLSLYQTGGDFCRQYTDNTFETELPSTPQYVNEGKLVEVKVESGKTYYFLTRGLSKGELTVTFGEKATPLELLSLSKEEGTTLNLSIDTLLGFTFNRMVKVGNCTLSSGSVIGNLTASTHDYGFTVSIKDVLYKWLKEGNVKAGDEVVLTVTGLCNANDENDKYNGNGVLTVKYIAGALPAELVSVTNSPEDMNFLSYYLPTDERGVVTLTFNRSMGEDATAKLFYGDIEGSNVYTESLPVKVKDTQLIVDLRGKRRLPSDMLPNASADVWEQYKTISLKVSNVKDVEGNYAMSTSQGTTGSYTFNYTIEVVEFDIARQFTPDEGTSLDDYPTIELWIREDDSFTYEGVDFTYSVNGKPETVFVPISQITKKDSPDGDGVLLTIPVPNKAADENSDVVVSLNNLKAADGADYSEDFTIIYKTSGKSMAGLEIESVSPADGAAIAALEAGSFLELSTNMNDRVGYVWFRIDDQNPKDPDQACVKTMTSMKKETVEGKVSFRTEIIRSVTFFEGHTYKVTFNAYASESDYQHGADALGVMTVTYTGTTPEFKFSPVKFVGITPDPDYTVISDVSQNEFTLTFDGPVVLNHENAFVVYGQGMNYPFESIESNEDGTEWTVKASLEKLMEMGMMPRLSMSFMPVDKDGMLVEGNAGKDATSYLNFAYDCTIGIPDLQVSPESGSKVESLKEIIVGCKDIMDDNGEVIFQGGISESYMAAEKIILYKNGREPVATVTSIEPIIPEDQEDNYFYVPVEMKLTLDTEITDNGNYRLHIPANYFILGTGMSNVNSKETSVLYTIDQPIKITVTPEDNSTVESLKEITIECESGIDVPSMGTIQLLNAQNEVVASATGEDCELLLPEGAGPWDPYTGVTIKLDQEVTEKGTYKLVIPEGFFYLGENYENSDEMTFTYSINASGIHSIGTESKGVVVYTVDGKFILKSSDAKDVKNLKKGLYIVNGKKMMVK